MAGSHNARTTSWVTVGLIILGSILLGFALPMQSIVLGVLGGLVFVAGVVTGFAFRIMDDYY